MTSAEWLRNLARNYADGVPGMKPEDHHAWDIAIELERLEAYNKIAHKEIDRMIVERSALKAKIEALMERELRYFGEVPL